MTAGQNSEMVKDRAAEDDMADFLSRPDSEKPQQHNQIRRIPGYDDGLWSQIERARARVAAQYEPSLYEEMSEAEITQERRFHEWMRARRRRNRRRAFRRDLAAEFRDTTYAYRARLESRREKRWHDQALAARRRVSDPHARVATLHRQMTRMSRNLGVVIGGGLLMSAVNVGRNYVPDDHGPGGPTWWLLWVLSFGVEFLISIPIRELMALTTTAARHGRKIDRSRIILFGGLSVVTVGLNAGPHLASGDLRGAALYAVAPVAIVACMSIHAWLSNRYAALIEDALSEASTKPDLEVSAELGDGPDLATAARVDAMGSVGPPRYPSAVRTVMAPPIPDLQPSQQQLVRPPQIDFGEVPIQPLPRLTQQTDRAPTSGEQRPDLCEHVAAALVMRGLSKLDEEHLAAILRMAEQGENANAIATKMTETTGNAFTRSTVDRAISRARQHGFGPIGIRQEVAFTA